MVAGHYEGFLEFIIIFIVVFLLIFAFVLHIFFKYPDGAPERDVMPLKKHVLVVVKRLIRSN